MKRVAVIGLGNIATRHRRNLKHLFPDTTLFAMPASGRVPVEPVSYCEHLVVSVDELITQKVELVIVASPASLHALHAIPLIEAGIPTLIEKPITTTLDDAISIQQAIDKHTTPVAIGYCLRYIPSALKLRDLLADSKVGTLYNAHIEIGQYLPDWRPTKDYRQSVSASKALGGGVLFELSHELDYAQWLLGPLTVKHALLRSTSELDLDVEDIADLFMATSNDIVATIHLDFLQRKAFRKCSFVGSEGRIDWNLIENELTFSSCAGTETLYHDPEWDKNEMYLSMLADFIKMIEGTENTCVTTKEAIKTIDLIDKIKCNASGC